MLHRKEKQKAIVQEKMNFSSGFSS